MSDPAPRLPKWLAPAILVVALMVVYLPDLGHGFVKDDFAWIRSSRIRAASELPRLFTQDNGFYRPLVALTFAIDHAAFGLDAFAYGATNLVLLLLAAAALWVLGRGLSMPPAIALLACAVWAFDPHGIPMAVLWISGRTSLVLTLFSLLAAISFVEGRTVLATLWCLAALLSKEEAVLLPPILLAWAALLGRPPLRRAWIPFMALPPYLLLRAQTHAYVPSSAPAYYRLSLGPGLIARNALEYADRSCTVGAVVLLVLWALARRRPRLAVDERRWLGAGLVWLVGGFGLTLFLPIRSSLYACFPSIGAALMTAAVAQALLRDIGGGLRRAVLAAGLIAPFALVPVYRARSARWVKPAELSARVLADLAARPARPGEVTVLHEQLGTRANLGGAFGTLIGDASKLFLGDDVHLWIEPPPPYWRETGLRPPEPGEVRRDLFLEDGGLREPGG